MTPEGVFLWGLVLGIVIVLMIKCRLDDYYDKRDAESAEFHRLKRENMHRKHGFCRDFDCPMHGNKR